MQDSDAGLPPSAAGLGSRAARNTILVLVARVLSRLIALVAVLAVNRHLGAEGFGRLQTVVTYSALVSVVLDLGFNTLYQREGARHPEELGRYLDNVLSVKALLAVAGLGVLALALRIPGLDDLLLPGFAVMALAAYSNLLRGTFYATGRLGWEAAAIVLESAVLLGVCLAGFATGQGVAYYLWAYAISYAVSCLWFATLTVALGIARPRWRFELAVVRPWFVTGLPLAVTYVLTNVYFKIDVPILQQVKPFSEVGWYTAAYKPFEALLFIPFTIRQVVFPVLSVYHRSTPDRMTAAARTLFRSLLVTGWPCTVGLVVLAPQLNGLLRLDPQSEPALRILGLGVVVMFVDNTFVAALTAMDRQRTYMGIALAGLLVNLALDLSLIPTHGYLGAAPATVLTEGFLAATGWAVLARAGSVLAVPAISWRILLAGGLMGTLLLAFHGARGWGTVAAVLTGGVVYCVLCALLRVFDAEERALGLRALGLVRR